MNTQTITFTPTAENMSTGTLNIPGVCSLEALYKTPQCPLMIKKTLETHVNWQMRCETPIHRGLALKNQYMPFRAAMSIHGAEKINADESAVLTLSDAKTGYAMVRPTPAHTPIVTAFVRINLEDNIIQDSAVAITGIEKRRISKPDTSGLNRKPLNKETIKSFAKNISSQYAGFSDFNGSAEYRQAMVAVTVERALTQCTQEVNHE